MNHISVLVMLIATQACAGDLMLLVLKADGHPMSGCVVKAFHKLASGSQHERDYKEQFLGLAGTHIPPGKYDARIACGQAELFHYVTVDRNDQFEVVPFGSRVMISEHVKPKLTIKLERPPSTNETWWIRFSGLYGGDSDIDRFTPTDGKAEIIDPEPGRYLVMVQATTGYTCVREVEFVEFTRNWSFHPADCSFEFDRFAHLIERDQSHKPKFSPWTDEMQKEKDDLFRELAGHSDKR